MSWWKQDEPQPAELKPGCCECTHQRCCHERGKGRCHAIEPEWVEKGFICACQIFIPKKDDGGGDAPQVPVDPELAELRKMLQ